MLAREPILVIVGASALQVPFFLVNGHFEPERLSVPVL